MNASRGSARSVWMLVLGLVGGLVASVAIGPLIARGRVDVTRIERPRAVPTPETRAMVTALGRLRPGEGVIKVAGPSSQMAVVVGRLMVKEGDRATRGQVVALLDTHAAQQAAVDRLTANVQAQLAAAVRAQAVLRGAEAELHRLARLHKQGMVSDSQQDSSRLAADAAQADVTKTQAEINLARADLRRAEEDLEMTVVRAPIDGQVLKVHTQEGEKVGPDGILELADNSRMYAVAEVYETDVSRIRVGQRAAVRTPVYDHVLTGVVERIGLKIGKMDILGTDPAAKTDARVVEVAIRLDESAEVNTATNLQVTVSIDVSGQPAATAAAASPS